MADLEGLDAQEAVERIEGGAEGEMPLPTGLRFPGPVAQAFFNDDRPVVGIQGPVGGGKTTTVMYSRLRRAVRMPRSVIDGVRHYKLIGTRETYRQLWSSTIPSYLETIPKKLGSWSGGRGAPVMHRVEFEDEFGPIEWIAEFMAFGDDLVASMRGLQTVDLWLNEADTNPVETLMLGIGRINRWPGQRHFQGYRAEFRSYGQVVGDFNAPDRDNWTFGVFHDEERRAQVEAEFRAAARGRVEEELRREGLDGAAQAEERERRLAALPESFIGFHNQPGGREAGAENLDNLPPGYYATQVATMKMAGRGDLIARMVDNRVTYLRAGDPVFKREYSPAIHLSQGPLEVDPSLPLRIGLDQGFLGAAVVAQFRPPFQWRVLADLMFPRERLMAREFGNRLFDLLEGPRFAGCAVEGAWGDMAGEHGASQAADENATWNMLVGQAAGIRVKPQRIGSNRIQPRLEAVRAALEHLHGGQPGLVIDGVNCRFLPAAFEARYVWTDEVNASGDRRKVPDKSIVEANAMDALQYLLLSEVRGDGANPMSFGRPVETRRIGAPLEKAGLTTGYDVLDPYERRSDEHGAAFGGLLDSRRPAW